MKSARILICTLAGAILIGGCGDKRHEPSSGAGGVPAVVKGATVMAVAAVPMAETVELSGTVRARTSAVLAARVAGSITFMKVREGDRVKKGELLIRLDAQESLATAAAAAAGSDEARHGIDEALARKKLTEATFERYQRLFNEQAVTRQEFDQKQTEKELASQGVARAEARLKQALESSRAAGTVADYTKIAAPLSGVITARHADPGATVFPGQPLLTIEDEGNYLLELAVPENLGSKVRVGTTVQVSLEPPGKTVAGRISEVLPAADPGSRTFTAKLPLVQKGLKTGMFARAAVDLGTATSGIMLPKAALVERGALTSVWIVDTEKIARLRLVKTGKTIADRVEILAGLSAGEQVVVAGVEKVSEGARVE